MGGQWTVGSRRREAAGQVWGTWVLNALLSLAQPERLAVGGGGGQLVGAMMEGP